MADTKQLEKRISDVTNILRKAYYKNHQNEVINDGIKAFGGSENESIGPWPEYNLRGIYCSRSECGLCTPCFYSKFANVIGISTKEAKIESLKEQIDQIVGSTQKLSKTQNNDIDSPNKVACLKKNLKYKNSKPMALCITPVGSFFDAHEMYPEVVEYLLDKLIEKSDELKRDIILYVEAHVMDFLKSHKNGYLDRFMDKYKRVHLRVVFGFESKDDFVRNVLYRKNLTLKSFEEAVEAAHSRGFGVFAFVFSGLYPMTEKEMSEDVKGSFEYLKKLGVRPVLMISNTQPYTISDVLQSCKIDTLIEPKTFAKMIKLMLKYFGVRFKNGLDPWLAADPVGGPPDPKRHIFKEDVVNKIYTCGECTKRVRKAVENLRLTLNKKAFLAEYDEIIKCDKHNGYEKYYNQKATKTLIERTEEMMDLVEANLEDYIATNEAEEIANVKAGLLCEGAILDQTTKKLLTGSDYMLDENFIHSSNLIFRDTVINMNMSQGFAKGSRFKISTSEENGKVYTSLHCEDEFCGEISFIPLPSWAKQVIDGEKVYQWLRPHSKTCISIWPNPNCALEKKCAFCSLEGEKALPPQTAVKMVDSALSKEPHYDINLGGGIYRSEEENIEYFCTIVKGIREKYQNKISLETMPPRKIEDIRKYKDAGVTTMIMNLEVANEELRRKICPSKSQLSKEHYYKAFDEAVKCFGEWKVASVLIAGIQDDKDLINEVKRMVEHKVLPIIMPYQPIRGNGNGKYNYADYLHVTKQTSNIIKSAHEDVLCKLEACVKCGACSMENILLK